MAPRPLRSLRLFSAALLQEQSDGHSQTKQNQESSSIAHRHMPGDGQNPFQSQKNQSRGNDNGRAGQFACDSQPNPDSPHNYFEPACIHQVPPYQLLLYDFLPK